MAFQVTYNGITISEANESTNGLEIHKLDGFDGLGIRNSKALLTGSNGGNIYNQLYGMRTLGLEGIVDGHNNQDDYFSLKADLVKAFSINDNNLLTITRWGNSATPLVIGAKVVTSPMIIEKPGEDTFAKWRVELECGEPFFKDESDSSYTIYLEDTSNLGGPLGASGGPVPMALGGGGATNRQLITNSGDLDWYLDSIRFTGAVNTPRLTNLATGEAIYYDSTITAASYVEIRKGQDGYYAVDNNGVNVLEDIVGDYPLIQQGDNTLVFSAAVYSANASCTLTWRNRYLNIY